MEPPIRFTEEERRFIRDTAFFQAKAAITEKIKRLLEELREELRYELAESAMPLPDGVDRQNGQLVKGEHLLDFPYLYLDFPKYFSQGEIFTYRTLFWWGHHLVFALILDGRQLDRYKENLMTHYDRLAGRGVFLLMTPTPWEWRKSPEYLLELRPDNREAVAAAVAERPFLKLHRFVAFDDPAVADGTIVKNGRDTFRLMALIAAP